MSFILFKYTDGSLLYAPCHHGYVGDWKILYWLCATLVTYLAQACHIAFRNPRLGTPALSCPGLFSRSLEICRIAFICIHLKECEGSQNRITVGIGAVLKARGGCVTTGWNSAQGKDPPPPGQST